RGPDMTTPHVAPAPGASLPASIGAATVTTPLGMPSRQLILDADKGLSPAKNSGRNQVAAG
ncbi:diguanylate cyclase response regulator, partial [Pseudomonas syringae]